jgi:probable addiction module antidote protein
MVEVKGPSAETSQELKTFGVITMPKRTREHHAWLLEQLTDPRAIATYLDAAINDSQEMFLIALRNVAEAHKMSRVADKAGVGRESLYKTLSNEGNPRLNTLEAVLGAVGVKISIQPQQQLATTGSTGGGQSNRAILGGTVILMEAKTKDQKYSNASSTLIQIYGQTWNGGNYTVTSPPSDPNALNAMVANLLPAQGSVTGRDEYAD